VALLLNFACANKYIDRVVVGVDSHAHLVEIVNAQNSLGKKTRAVLEQLYTFKEDNERLYSLLSGKRQRQNEHRCNYTGEGWFNPASGGLA